MITMDRLEQAGSSKWAKCKARDFLGSEAYELYAAATRDERNAAVGPFSAAC